jgi:uncharacterized repeat protein (TIGR03803 family)
MLMLLRLRRLAALSCLALPIFAAPSGAIAARTQEANFIVLAALGASTVVEAPSGMRGDLLLANDGNFYAASSGGGKGAGAIVRIAPDGTITVLRSIENSRDGVSSYARLIQASDGHLYGTTYAGGDENVGVVFRMTLAGEYTVLRSFGQNKQDAILPYAGLVQAPDGNLYGTTLRGGTNDKGAVFRIGLAGDFAILHQFDGGNGENPEGNLIIGADGNLYGTTLQGGTDNRGTIFRISTGGNFASVYSFSALGRFNTAGLATNTTGANPRAGLLLAADGNYYGTAYQGGANGYGTVFRMTPTGTVTTVHSFTGPSFGGGFPLSAVTQDAAGNLYGTSERGGYLDRGSAWRITPSGAFSLLHGFNGSIDDGSQPYTTLVPVGGELYGVTSGYGRELVEFGLVSNMGVIFKLDPGTNGVLPVELSVSTTDTTVGSGATLTWSSPTAVSCIGSGAWNGDIATSGTLSVTLSEARIYTYVLSCKDGAGITRSAYATVISRAPPAQPVDGGGGAGSMSALYLLLLAGLIIARNRKETSSACP